MSLLNQSHVGLTVDAYKPRKRIELASDKIWEVIIQFDMDQAIEAITGLQSGLDSRSSFLIIGQYSQVRNLIDELNDQLSWLRWCDLQLRVTGEFDPEDMRIAEIKLIPVFDLTGPALSILQQIDEVSDHAERMMDVIETSMLKQTIRRNDRKNAASIAARARLSSKYQITL